MGILGRNAFLYGIGNLSMQSIGFLLIPLYTKTLSMEDCGLLLTLLVTVELLSVLMGMEMTTTLVRFYSGYESEGRLGTLLGTSLLVQLGGYTLVGAALLAFVSYASGRASDVSPVAGYIPPLLALAACRSLHRHMISFYRARNDPGRYNAFAITAALVALGSTVTVTLGLNAGVKAILLAQAASYGLLGGCAFLAIIRNVRPEISTAIIPHLLRYGLPLVVAEAAWFVLSASDRYFVAHFVGLREAAIYGIGYRIASVLLVVVVMPFQLAYAPFVFAIADSAEAPDKIARAFYYLVSILLVCGAALALTSSYIIRALATPAYGESYLATLYLLPVTIMLGLYYWAGALIHIVKKTYVFGIVTALASGLNLGLNYLLVPRLGWRGAALATNVSYLIACGVVFANGLRFFPIPLRRQGWLFLTAIITAVRRGLVRLWPPGDRSMCEMWNSTDKHG